MHVIHVRVSFARLKHDTDFGLPTFTDVIPRAVGLDFNQSEFQLSIQM